jgi:hypothetical protein
MTLAGTKENTIDLTDLYLFPTAAKKANISENPKNNRSGCHLQ